MARFEDMAILLHPSDNVGVVKRAIAAATTLESDHLSLHVTEALAAGHKVAIRTIEPGEPVIKYGQHIGYATQPIAAGNHVHVHNLGAGSASQLPAPLTALEPQAAPLSARLSEASERFATMTFPGFLRTDGRVGTRNYIAVISSVNCSASVSRYVAEAFKDPRWSKNYPGVDGVIALTHKGGCAMDPGEPQRVLQRVLAGMARHPNIGGFVIIGLGCEVNQTSSLIQAHHLEQNGTAGIPTPVFNIQQVGSVRRTVQLGIEAVEKLYPAVHAQTRTPQPLSKLTLALNCGGSDGHSGCTANPALGVASDLLVLAGGTSVLAETPEIFGAEHLLLQRAASPEVGEKLLKRIRWWEDHVRKHDTAVDNNPSFGNKQGGLTTLSEKSLGAVAKGGQSILNAVYEYAETITAKGFCFMDTPGYDPVSMTGLVAGGCNVAVFTTGRGSVYGCKPTPCLKVASHSALYRHMEEDMDLNAGKILSEGISIEEVGIEILERVVATAGGAKTKSEQVGLGDEEFAPWMLGPTL